MTNSIHCRPGSTDAMALLAAENEQLKQIAWVADELARSAKTILCTTDEMTVGWRSLSHAVNQYDAAIAAGESK